MSPYTVSAQAPAHLWSQRFGSTVNDFGNAVAVDGEGNVLVTGRFAGTANFGGGDLVSAGSWDIFVAKYNAAGVHQWSQRFGSTSRDQGNAVAVDGEGNVLVTGYFQGTVNFGGSNLASAGFEDIFVAKYDAAGVHQWSRRVGGSFYDFGNAVGVDGLGNVLVTGQFYGPVDFGGGNLTGLGNSDIFVAKYDAAGVHQWSQRFGSDTADVGYALAVDGSGNVLVTGRFGDTGNFGGGNLVSAGDSDIFVAKYDAAGVHQWSQRFGSTFADIGYAVTVDGSGNVLATGQFYGTVDFGGASLVSAGGLDVFVAKYNSAGAHQWSQRFGTTSNDIGYAMAVDAPGNVLVTGQFVGAVDFGGGNLVGVGLSDIFLAKYGDAATEVGDTPLPGSLSVTAYPNPFNPSVTVRYSIPRAGRVTIGIYDARGASVATLLDEERPAGAYMLPWDGRSDSGAVVSSGVYFARIAFGGEKRAYKLVVLK